MPEEGSQGPGEIDQIVAARQINMGAGIRWVVRFRVKDLGFPV